MTNKPAKKISKKPVATSKIIESKQTFFGETFSLPETEEKVLTFWKENDIFGQSLKLREKGKPFIFYEGPPGANGKPGIHHVLSRVTKDVFLRYQTMRGRYVPRKSGWDTHGLPVELAAEKQLGFKNKKDIEAYGIAAFNKVCQELVWEHEGEWKDITERIGFWLDLENPYMTCAPDYIESLWNVVGEMDKKGYLYRGHKVIPWCTRCGTGLSAAEVALGYQNVEDMTATVLFKLAPGQVAGKKKLGDRTSIAAWTTTPWTLPGNVALAVGPDVSYSIVVRGNTKVIVATDLVEKHFGVEAETVAIVTGADLAGLRYEPLFEVEGLSNENSHRVRTAKFVTTTDGTGIVHIAPMYGEDDYALGLEYDLPQLHTVDEVGRFTKDVLDLAGLYVKAPTTEAKILDYLKQKEVLLVAEPHEHEYPHCWRCSTPLLYYAKNSWFVAMSKLRKQMSERNDTVNWVPEHTKEGRFGNWLREARDWNFSRERYWGTPLPVWRCEACDTHETMGSLEELHARSGGSKNEYWLMRHGEADHNVEGILDSDGISSSLTPRGMKQVEKAAKDLKAVGIDLIVASPAKRTQETAHLVADLLDVPVVTYDERLRETNLGTLSGKKLTDLHSYWNQQETPTLATSYPGGESEADVRRRMWLFIQEFEKSHAGRKVLIVSHDGPLRMLTATAEMWTDKQALTEVLKPPFLDTGSMKAMSFHNVPRDEDGVVNLHRPYVDAVLLPCKKCGVSMSRTPETIDVWFDSGAMPLAQQHYPFTGKGLVDGDKTHAATYPADFIAEGVDQTRGWFYSLLEVATALGRPAPYKNVISLGLLHDKFGKKMSKSKGNVLDPWELIGKHGVDAVRWYFFAGSDPGDSKNFDEAELGKAVRRVHLIAYNTLSFWKMYGQNKTKAVPKLSVLDQWIISRRNETVAMVTKSFDAYDSRTAILAVESLVDDLSRWYVRSSRKRLQRASSQGDYAAASQTLKETLLVLTQLTAPFAPFFAEAMYHELRDAKSPMSVHLTDWPKAGKSDKKLTARMALVRDLAAAGLSLRAKSGLKVRQPLATMWVQTKDLAKEPDLLALLASEVNVKAITTNSSLTEPAALDEQLTPELLAEGAAREVTRAIQELRQQAGLEPGQAAVVYVTGSAFEGIRPFAVEIAKDTTSEIREKSITTAKAETTVKLPGGELWLGLKKA